MNDNTNQNTQQDTQTSAGTEGTGRMFTQSEVNAIIQDRLARVKAADDGEYKAKYEAVKQELEGYKAAEGRKAKEAAYRAILEKAAISEKRRDTVVRAAAVDGVIDNIELDETGAAKNADKLLADVKETWADFIVTTVVHGADTPFPPQNNCGPTDPIAEAFKPKI